MSLLDSFLLDPPKLDVWFALRTDGVQGSGTESDPYNGSLRYEAALSVSSLTRSGREATATIAANHGYANGDVVTIAGVSGAEAQFYNGTFVIYGVTSTTFNYWMKADPGASVFGTMSCARTHYPFDDIRGTILAYLTNITIRLGPGVFPTRGLTVGVGGIPVFSGQKVIGSGMGVTTLKLVNAATPNAHYYVIGSGGALEYFELSDLTLDCNLDGQLIAGYTFPPIACGGVFVSGAHVRYRRVRVINFGDLSSAFECFVMWSAGAVPGSFDYVDCVMEDCILEQPAINQCGLVTVINMGAGERSSDGIMAYHRACIVRNCVIDCEYKLNPVAITGINVSGGVATVTTALPHGRANGDWVRISGAILNDSTNNSFNGSYTISNVTTSGFTYTPSPTQTTNPTGELWLDRFSSHLVAVTNISKAGTGPYTITVTTATPHFRVKGNNVVVNQAAPFNGSFEVTDVPSPTQLKFVLNADPGNWSQTGFEFIGMTFQAISNDGGTAAVVEGNRIFNTRTGGPYHDTYNTRDITVRNNHYRGVAVGPAQSLGLTSAALQVIRYHNTNPAILYDRIKRTGDGKTALFTTQYNHGYSKGQAVKISFAQVGGNPAPSGTYNGYYSVESIPASNQFTYRMLNDPGADADASPVPQFETLWQTGSIVIENNLIELIGSINTYGPPVAILLAKYVGDPSLGAQRLYKRVVVHDNVIRRVENATDAPGSAPSAGIQIVYCEDALIENNVIDLETSTPIQHAVCDQVRYFNNTNPAGALIQGVDVGQAGNPKQSELSTAVEDANLLAF